MPKVRNVALVRCACCDQVVVVAVAAARRFGAAVAGAGVATTSAEVASVASASTTDATRGRVAWVWRWVAAWSHRASERRSGAAEKPPGGISAARPENSSRAMPAPAR